MARFRVVPAAAAAGYCASPLSHVLTYDEWIALQATAPVAPSPSQMACHRLVASFAERKAHARSMRAQLVAYPDRWQYWQGVLDTLIEDQRQLEGLLFAPDPAYDEIAAFRTRRKRDMLRMV